MLTEKFNSEAINQNIKPIADFFRMHGDETGKTYSDLLMSFTEILLNDELNNPSRSVEKISETMFLIRELNQLVLSVQNPVDRVSVESN
jgi:hypothetical protein